MKQADTVLIGPAPRIAVETRGDGPLVLFLHGIGGNRSNWREQLEALAHRYRVAAWDARGYGDSDDYEGSLTFSDFNDDLLRVLAYFREPAAHIVGLSMGGMIAQNFYRCHPDKVLSLVLADTRNGFNRHNSEEFLRKREAPLLAGLTPKDIAPGLARTLAGPKATPEIILRLTQSIGALHKESYLKTLRASSLVGESDDFRGLQGYVDLASVHVPSLIVCGTADTVTPPDMSRQLAAGIGNSRLAWIEDAGHLSNIEAPERFNEVLLEFLDARA